MGATKELSGKTKAGTSSRKKAKLEQITDSRIQQATFKRLKNGLMKKAMELSVLCGCDIALVVFDSNNQLFQYSSRDMDAILQKYSQACHEPHETRNNEDLFVQPSSAQGKDNDEDVDANAVSQRPSRTKADAKDASLTKATPTVSQPSQGEVDPSPSGQADLEQNLKEWIAPLGLPEDFATFQLSPRSEKAYQRINREFDRLLDQVQSGQLPPPDPAVFPQMSLIDRREPSAVAHLQAPEQGSSKPIPPVGPQHNPPVGSGNPSPSEPEESHAQQQEAEDTDMPDAEPKEEPAPEPSLPLEAPEATTEAGQREQASSVPFTEPVPPPPGAPVPPVV